MSISWILSRLVGQKFQNISKNSKMTRTVDSIVILAEFLKGHYHTLRYNRFAKCNLDGFETRFIGHPIIFCLFFLIRYQRFRRKIQSYSYEIRPALILEIFSVAKNFKKRLSEKIRAGCNGCELDCIFHHPFQNFWNFGSEITWKWIYIYLWDLNVSQFL